MADLLHVKRDTNFCFGPHGGHSPCLKIDLKEKFVAT